VLFSWNGNLIQIFSNQGERKKKEKRKKKIQKSNSRYICNEKRNRMSLKNYTGAILYRLIGQDTSIHCPPVFSGAC